MDTPSPAAARAAEAWLEPGDGDLAAFREEIDRAREGADWRLADTMDREIPVYAGERVRAAAPDAAARRELSTEWIDALLHGPGVIVIRNGAPRDVVARATEVFERLIEAEREGGGGAGDHFARPGANNRVWNAAQKHCLADPRNFALYYASDAIAMASEAWLGPGYQVTAQVNRVNPGGAAQSAHRDYHLGFMAPDRITGYPAHVHRLSPFLTLQGAVAHCDMPVETGPTMFLPFSQRFREGYLAFSRPDFQEFFAERHVQLPLGLGDMVFFNPALMHGAGTNRTADVRRMANLLQVSSAFGRAMESVDRALMARSLYPALRDLLGTGGIDRRGAANAIAACAEGYAFPTNLDSDPPVGGLAPPSQAARMAAALEADASPEDFALSLAEAEARRLP